MGNLFILHSLEAVDRQLLEHLGMVVEEMSPNQAVCQMVVREQMCNSHHYCQGGLIFAFADQAFAYACMSANRAGVTLSANIIFNTLILRKNRGGSKELAQIT